MVFDDKISNDLQTPADKVGKDRKQPEKPIDKEDNLGDDDITKESTNHKNKLKKGGRIPWWHRLIDDNARNNQHSPKDTVRNDDRDANPNLKADRFRQRS